MKKTIGSVLALVLMVSLMSSTSFGSSELGCNEKTYPFAMARIKAEQEKLAVRVQFGDTSAVAKLNLVTKVAQATSAEHMNQILSTLTDDEKALARQIDADEENSN